MKRLGFAILLIVFMLPLIPLRESMALYPVASHTAPCSTVQSISPFFYMFGHANIGHWLINSWCILMLHNIFRTYRFVVAYASSVLFGLVWVAVASAMSVPVIGFSAILFWFYGYLIPYYWHKRRSSIVYLALFLLVGFIIPNMAGIFHAGLLVMGFVFYHLEWWHHKFWSFLTEDGN